MAMQLPYPRLLISVVDRAREAVFKSRNNPDGIQPLYDEEDAAHKYPFVWLVVGWSIGHPNTDLSHVEGDEAIDMSRPGYTGQYHVKVKIPQVEDTYDVPAGDTEDLVEWIHCEFNRQLDGGPTGSLYKPRDRKDRPKMLRPKVGSRNSRQPYQSRRDGEPILPNDQALTLQVGVARIAGFNNAKVHPPLFDEEHPGGYVWLGVGWNPHLSPASREHCRCTRWGAEGLSPEDLIHTCLIRVMIKIPQAENRGTPAEVLPFLRAIKAELLNQLAQQTA